MNRNSENNMTGDPNQTNPSSVFGFDPYPPPHVNWIQSEAFNNPQTQFQPGPSPSQSQICFPNPTVSPFTIEPVSHQQIGIPSGIPNNVPQFITSSFPQDQMNFSFGTPRPAQDVVQFPFQIDHGFGPRVTHSIRCKRKTDDEPQLHAVKQRITEEKMAEHMSKLHINSETATCSKESDLDRTQRLYLCEEMRRLQTESILPQSLLSGIPRPCTALVLWKPPTRLVPLENNDTDENENNNTEPDNAMVNESEMDNDINNMDMDNL